MADYNIDTIVQAVLAQLAAVSQGVGELRTVTSLEGLVSLPALANGKKEVVNAPLSLLAKPATDAAAAAQQKIATAQEKIEAMTTALQSMTTLTNETKQTKDNAIKAAEDAAKKLTEMSTLMQSCQTLFNGISEKSAQADSIIQRVGAITQHAGELESQLAADAQAASGYVSQLQAWATAEDARKQVETARVNAENARKEAETARAQAETARVAAETSRVDVEELRVSAEDTRKEAETARVNAENTRKQAEDARVLAEQKRAEAESTRVTATNTAIQNADDKAKLADDAAKVADVATGRANTAASNADAKAQLAEQAASNANQKAQQISTAEQEAERAASEADFAASSAAQKAVIAGTAAENADAAAQRARDAAASAEAKAITKQEVENVLTGEIVSHGHPQSSVVGLVAKLSEIEAVAKGAKRAKTFKTQTELNAWIAIPANVTTLQIGDDLYIEEDGVPDYWWTGVGILPLETRTISLVDYLTKELAEVTYLKKAEIAAWALGANKPTYTPAEVGAASASHAHTEYSRVYGQWKTGSQTGITTTEFITLLTNVGAFSQGHWIARGTWDYAGNYYITDSGFGNIHLAGAVIEVFGTSEYTIRILTPTTTSAGAAATLHHEFVYVNNGPTYSPGWRKVANTSDLDKATGDISSALTNMAAMLAAVQRV